MMASLLRKWPYLQESPINLNHTMMKNEEISSSVSTMDRGVYRSQIVVLAGS